MARGSLQLQSLVRQQSLILFLSWRPYGKTLIDLLFTVSWFFIVLVTTGESAERYQRFILISAVRVESARASCPYFYGEERKRQLHSARLGTRSKRRIFINS